MKYSEGLVAIGMQRLSVWHDRALNEAEQAVAEGIFMPGLNDAVPEDVLLSDIRSVVVYQVPSGRWHCDIVLSSESDADDRSIGTMDGCDAKAEAEMAGFSLLIGVMSILKTRNAA